MIVEDDDLIRGSLRALLTDEGYTVETAPHGAEAIALLHVRRDARLILLDLMMPVLDGWAVLHELRANAELARIPVCVITAHPDTPEGAAEVLHKPLDGARVLDVIERRASRVAAV